MKNFGAFAVFGAIASAAPLVKRDIVWITETNVDVVTVPVTKTVWVEWPGSTQTVPAGPHAPPATTTSSSTATVVISTSTSTSTPSSTPVSTSTSTSVYVAPSVSSSSTSSSVVIVPTTSATVAPATTAAPTSTTTSSAAAVTSTSAAVTSGTVYTGDITYYAVGLGSCGYTNTEDEAVVALAEDMMTANWSGNPNDNPLCGSVITITTGGVSKTATIVDTCPGCDGASLDLSSGLFQEFDDLSVGRVSGVTWSYN